MEKTQVKFNQETQSLLSSVRGTALDLSSDGGKGKGTMVQPLLVPTPCLWPKALPSYPLHIYWPPGTRKEE